MSHRLPDSAKRAVGDSLTRRLWDPDKWQRLWDPDAEISIVHNSPTRRVAGSTTHQLGESGGRRLSDLVVRESLSEYFSQNSPIRRVGESTTSRLGESESQQLPGSVSQRVSDSLSQGVVFWLQICQIRNENRNGLKSRVRDSWVMNFCKSCLVFSIKRCKNKLQY